MISPHWRSSEEILSSILDRREERAERRTAHIGELRKRAAETDAKLKRLYDAIENGVADLADPMLKDRIAELKARRNGRPPPPGTPLIGGPKS
jgi:site-specific DNA recombinase